MKKKIKSVADFKEAFERIKHTCPSGLVFSKEKVKGATLIRRDTFASDKEFERFKKNTKAQKYADKLAKKKKLFKGSQWTTRQRKKILSMNKVVPIYSMVKPLVNKNLIVKLPETVCREKATLKNLSHSSVMPSVVTMTRYANPTIVEDKPKKLRRKNITTKYLKSQEPELWEKVEESVSRDMAVQRTIHNSDKNREFKVGLIPIEYVEAIAHNAAFIAVSEHLKRTRK
jgi:hypothetical protein